MAHHRYSNPVSMAQQHDLGYEGIYMGSRVTISIVGKCIKMHLLLPIEGVIVTVPVEWDRRSGAIEAVKLLGLLGVGLHEGATFSVGLLIGYDVGIVGQRSTHTFERR